METNSKPKEHTAKLKEQFKEISQHLRRDVEKVDDLAGKSIIRSFSQK